MKRLPRTTYVVLGRQGEETLEAREVVLETVRDVVDVFGADSTQAAWAAYMPELLPYTVDMARIERWAREGAQ